MPKTHGQLIGVLAISIDQEESAGESDTRIGHGQNNAARVRVAVHHGLCDRTFAGGRGRDGGKMTESGKDEQLVQSSASPSGFTRL